MASRPQFAQHSPLRADVCRRVDAYFAERGIDERGGARHVLKSATIFAWAIASYVLLVFVAGSVWTAVPAAISLGLAITGIGFCVMHDGGHGAASRRPWANRLSAAALDFIGASSFFWHQKHDVMHHTYTNVDGLDDDIDSTPFIRMATSQRRTWYHRFQAIYVWALLAFFVPKWVFYDDWKTWAKGRISGHAIPRPRGWDAAQLILGKVVFVSWALALPLAFHPVAPVLLAYAAVSALVGVLIALVFQLAHVVEETAFCGVPGAEERFERPFFEHQIATTANFAPRNRALTWFLGGLNFQIEHHLFPRVSHHHYPALATIVRDVCHEHGVTYHCHETARGAVGSHLRYLARLGRGAESRAA